MLSVNSALKLLAGICIFSQVTGSVVPTDGFEMHNFLGRRGSNSGAGSIEDPGIFPGPDGRSQFLKGWPELPPLPGAKIDNETFVVGKQKAVITTYINEKYDASKIKRVVIQLHGEYRDAWNQWMYANMSATKAAKASKDINLDEILVVAPMFFSIEDQGAYPVDSDGVSNSHALIWNQNGWGDVADAIYPVFDADGNLSNPSYNFTSRAVDKAHKASRQSSRSMKSASTKAHSTKKGKRNLVGLSDKRAESDGPLLASLDALDAYSKYFSDKGRFPNLKMIVMAGFSMGGQTVGRYITFRKDTENDDRINYWVASPASFMYLNSSRPVPNPEKCSGYDDYKYGLSGKLPAYFNRSVDTQKDILNRYLTRKTTYLVGSDDSSAGDTSCSAMVQGHDHVDRMHNWVNLVLPYLPGNPTPGKMPKIISAAVVDGVAHNAAGIILSTAGVQSLFLMDYNGRGLDASGPSVLKPGEDERGIPQNAAPHGPSPILSLYGSLLAVVASLVLRML
ncbi:hypothetical protein MVES1_002992 [Malassezia vespertilionis]|uniref:Uncharacterized protein n=1 Tax=Malassezia vespertilionis TaxID=2020962 RepID=A0A2N1J9P9_9BASI|nr:uncharacterized protein MVES1_002992 [Malassezia vespertilionis]PKI83266.1 hypothetical protein MVES_002835 [Malassezia vespertilionis]WFD07624.1 hypothetical protein MVES1_002992 [Malassezia vespertilionis]